MMMNGILPEIIGAIFAFLLAAFIGLLYSRLLKSRRLRKINKISSPSSLPHDLDSYFSHAGMKMISSVRRGYSNYYTWALSNEPQDIFFAGRSVLPRIDTDFRIRQLSSFENILVRKINEGSKIRILISDPTWEFLPQFAISEGQTIQSIYKDLQHSIDIVMKIWKTINSNDISFRGEFEIRLYRELIYYAYHRVKNINTEELQMYIGLYFSKRLGTDSPVFEVIDKSIQAEFEEHFLTIFNNSKTLLSYSSINHIQEFNQELFDTSKKFLVDKIGDEINHNNESNN